MKTSILEYLEGSAKKYPDKTAFADENTSCTFSELEKTARRTGTALAKHFTPRNPVPVFMEKSVETIGIFMGAVYAGCFYVLMDTKQPASRLQQILGILDSDVIVTSEKYLKDLEKLDFHGTVLMAPELAAEPENPEVLKAIREQALDVDPLYGIFTSGSTGVPKGVIVGHRSVLDFIDCFTELFDITDCVTVMRDGCYVATVQTRDTNRNELISLMVGRELTNTYPERNCVRDEVVLEVKNVSGFYNDNISFQLHRGEILGLSGLVGAGRTELARAIFGADKKLGGSICLYGKEVKIKSPSDAIKAGIGLIPEDRKGQGCFLNMTIEWNIAISNIRNLTTNRLVSKKKIAKRAEYFKNKLKIKTPSLKQRVVNLSGGNQQKVVLAKVLAANSDIIIFDEPTRGIDIGARHEIYLLMTELVKDGKAIIMISSDMEELLGMSDRIIVLSEGRITGEVQKEDFSQETVLRLASNE